MSQTRLSVYLFSLAVLFFGVAASCTPAQTAAWRTFGVDAAKCVGAGVVNAAGDALIDLLDHVSNDTDFNAATVGSTLATKYGSAAAVCALGKAAADLLPAVGAKVAPTPRAKRVQALLDSQKEWAK